jgi:hypothetical protein
MGAACFSETFVSVKRERRRRTKGINSGREIFFNYPTRFYDAISTEKPMQSETDHEF